MAGAGYDIGLSGSEGPLISGISGAFSVTDNSKISPTLTQQLTNASGQAKVSPSLDVAPGNVWIWAIVGAAIGGAVAWFFFRKR